MPTLNAVISGLVQGDGLTITVTVTKVSGDFKTDALTKAWFTVKNQKSDADSAALFQKVITTDNQTGIGQITDDGNVSGIGTIRIDLVNTDTVLLIDDKNYPFDLQIETVSGGATKPYTPWAGKIKMASEVTKATS